MDDRILTVQELARELRVSQRTIYAHCTDREPRLPAIRIGRCIRFRWSDVRRWADRLLEESGGRTAA